MKYIKILIISMLVLSLTGCDNSTKTSDKLQISVAIEPLRYFADRIFEDTVEVTTMIPQNASPENYEITTKQMMEFTDSDIYFSLNLPSETNSILEVVGENTEVVDLQEIVSEDLEILKLGESYDPHIWMSISRSKAIINTMLEEVIDLNSDNEDLYRNNAKILLAELDSLNNEINNSLKDVTNRYFIVYHPSLQYFANEYNLEMVSIELEGKEASANRIVEIIDFAKENNIKVVFYQAEIDSSQAESKAYEIGGQTVMVNPLAYDYLENYKNMSELIKDNMK